MKNEKIKTNKTKIIARVMLVILLLSSAINLAGCGNKELEAGFEGEIKDMAPIFVCAYKSDKSEFEIDNVTLTFYYGGAFESSVERDRIKRFSYPTFEIYFVNDEEMRILVKRVEENLVSEKYRTWIGRESKIWKKSKRFFNHSEVFTIPEDLFTKESGMIYFYLYGADVLINDEPEIICSIGICYNRNGNKITLSAA